MARTRFAHHRLIPCPLAAATPLPGRRSAGTRVVKQAVSGHAALRGGQRARGVVKQAVSGHAGR